ncbi:MAG: electron transfer flavoprotein subunit alpha/FixB family protein [Desulfurella sp.]|uniref:Electron transfer flavoprotein alpha subunit apoprotein n=1 Tax=Desulfurella multipotens TaxID=79269 RepID=A0A1G6J2Y7_9BACT|nr:MULTISPECIES: electron transfer flavoprotein subunit alpha/FixB family protein [Desulfurella]PMP68883.1 MAG: electron transfer flavoprotein subunit alpha/FixB family protein [Desulfurella multipotens]PMP87473.1 MAG: electron transfer flavoprotein subunit alpha/FixB family protein [Desulfurella sp.]SDC13007.1 electron transfer flavoprotein alpha subunit apoprotein [Desulfurella multipotens]HEX13077.1 electron transfer flavoprotein subunit alpha/FixB family protein [Desulfurella acetivorans]
MIKQDITQYKNVWVFIEHNEGKIERVSLELLSKGAELAKDLGCEVCAFTVGDKVEQFAKEVGEYGAKKFYIIENPALKEYRTEPWRDAIVYLIDKYKPEVALVGATTLGRDLAGTVATKLSTGLTADTTALDIDPSTKNLLMTRPTFGGNLMATIFCPDNRPQMSTVRPGVFKAVKNPTKPEIIKEKYDITEDKIVKKIIEKVQTGEEKVNLSFYEVIVAGGKGMGKKENLKLLEDLANVLGGTWAVSRKVVQAGWAPQSRQVGQTGQTVHPKIYIAAGISGAVQHVAGMKSSDIIIAINTDPEAPIFEVATYGIVGDCLQVLPKMTEMFKQKLVK